MRSCRRVLESIVDGMEIPQSPMERLSAGFHVFICSGCGPYSNQVLRTVKALSTLGSPRPSQYTVAGLKGVFEAESAGLAVDAIVTENRPIGEDE